MMRKLMTRVAPVLAIALAGGARAAPVQVLRNNMLVTVDSAAPGASTGSVAITGIGAGEALVGFDYRPANPRLLYGLSNTGQLYAINGRTGTSVVVGTPVATAATPAGAGVGVDFNPTVDRIRVVSTTGLDLRLNPATGAPAAIDGRTMYAGIDPNAAQTPTIAGSAYTNNVAGATSTTLYEIDTRGGIGAARLVTQGNVNVSPNTGILFTVGATGVTTTSAVGFDIARNGTAYASLTNPVTGVTSLYTVNLATGAATLLGMLAGNTTYSGLAVPLASFQSMGLTANQAAVGAALDNFTGIPNDGTLRLFNGIDSFTGNPAAQSALLQSLTPAGYTDVTLMSLNAVEAQETTLLRYTRDLRGQATMPDGTTATLDEAGRIGTWVSGGSRFGITDPAPDRYRTQFDEFHFMGGADFRLTPKIAFGAFGGYSSTNASFAIGDTTKGDLQSGFGGAYGTASVGPFYVDAWGSYTHLDWRLYRMLSFGGAYSGSTAARTNGRVYAAGGSTGLSFSFMNFEIEPFAAVRFADIKVDGFDETSGAAFALAIGDIKDKSLRGNLGARAGTKFEVAGATIRPQVRGGWYHDFWPGRRPFTAAFEQPGIGTPFSFQPSRFSSDYWNAGGALSISGNGPVSMYSDFDYQGDNERKFYTFSIGARLKL